MERKAPTYHQLPVEEVELRESQSSGTYRPLPSEQRSNKNRFWNLVKTKSSRRERESTWLQRNPFLIKIYIHGLPLTMVALVVIGMVLSVPSVTQGDIGSVCGVDGRYNFQGSNFDDGGYSYYNPWATSETFSINIAFGKFHFGTAKLIDVIWDVVNYHVGGTR